MLKVEVNLTKTDILHVRPLRKPQSNFTFLFDRNSVDYCTSYKYLGCTINEHLDYKLTVSLLADSAGRALSSIITKMIKNGGFPYSIFCTLYQACVCSIADYSSEVFGYESFDSSQKIYLRAARSFLGVPKPTSIPGIISEMNLLLPQSRAQIKMARQYHRVLKMSNSRLTKKVFFWDKNLNEHNNLNTWYTEVKSIFSQNNMTEIFESGLVFDLKSVVKKLENSMLVTQQSVAKNQCESMPKLRTFVKFKDFSNTPSYVTKPLSFIQRKFLAKLRLGCLEIRIETGRYTRPRLPEESRICLACPEPRNKIENEYHFIFECEAYQNERRSWLEKLTIPNNFSTLLQDQQLKLVLNDHNNVKLSAQFLINIYDVRSKLVTSHRDQNIVMYHLLPHDQCPACTYIVT